MSTPSSPKNKNISDKFVQLFRSKDFDEAHEFLPAALEIQRTPPSPLGRIIIWVIMLFFILTVIWAWLGKIDIVATATGQIVPVGKSKVIQSLETANIKEILVKDGDKVQPGDTLIRLETTRIQAEITQLQQQLSQQTFDIERIKQTLQKIEQPTKTHASYKTLPPAHQQLLQQEVNQYQQQLKQLNAQYTSYQADLYATNAAQRKLQKILPITQQRLESSQKLLQKQLLSKDQVQQIAQTVIEQTQDLEIETQRIKSIQSQLQQTKSQQAALKSQTKQNLMQRLLDTQRQQETTEQELIKAQQRLKQTVITSPIEGTVQQLALHTIGGVVTPAQELMVIVPKNQQFEIEAFLLNKDIGFVHEQQSAEVKIDTFNFTKYGIIESQIINISQDAIEHQELGRVYVVRLKMLKNNVYVKNKKVTLSPGMQVTVEIKTGQRKVIEYLLTPLLRYQNESIRER